MALQILKPPRGEQRVLFKELASWLQKARPDKPPLLVSQDGDSIPLPEDLYQVVRQVVHLLAMGHAVTIVPYTRLLTTQEAADLLNVSRQYLCRLLDRGEIPHVRVGTHRRVKFEDLMRYREQRDARRREKLRELTRVSEELGMYEG
jgi:excisionase family DNA binding protein